MKAVSEKSVSLSGEAYAREIKNYARLHDLCYRPGVIGRAPLAALGDWPGDWEGRTLLALSLHAQSLHTVPAFIERIVPDIRSLCNEKGYRGEIVDESAISEQIYPSNSWLMRGLIEYYRLTGKQFALDWVNEILDNLFIPLYPHLDHYPRTKAERAKEEQGEAAGTIKGRYREWRLSSDIGCVFIPMDGLTAAYELTGRSDLMPLIQKIIDLFLANDVVENRLQTHATVTFMRGIMRLYRLTGEKRLLDLAESTFEKYKKYGMTCCWANFNWFMTPSWTEPCAVIDSYMLAHQLWEATGKSDYLNDSQMILYNGFYRGQRPNGGFGCDTTCDDGTLETRKQIYEANWCCTMRGGEGLSYLAKTSVYTDGDDLVFPVFTDLAVELPCGAVSERSEYPVNGRVTFSVTAGDGAARRFRLFAPSRCENFRVFVNGAEAASSLENGFITVSVSMRPGTEIEYVFDPKLHAEPVTSAVYHLSDRFVIAYGTRILASDGNRESVDLSSFTRVSDEEWHADGMAFTPIANAYLLEKEALLASKYRVMFAQ